VQKDFRVREKQTKMKKQLDELIRNDRSLKVENKNAIPKMKHKRRCLKIILSIVTIFLVLLILAYIFVPTIADKKLNAVLNDPPYSYSEKAKATHSDLFVADLHADSLLTNRDLLKENSYGQIDIPRLIKGNVALQVFAVPSKVPISINIDKNSDEGDVLGVLAFLQRWPVITWWSAKEKALYQSEKLHKFEEKSNGKLEIIKTSSQLKRYIEKRKLHSQRTSAILAIEGAHVLENSIDNVNIFYNAGFRIVGLAHYFDNEVGGSAHGTDKGGLTKFGKK
jgi:regulator of replication initiation timing